MVGKRRDSVGVVGQIIEIIGIGTGAGKILEEARKPCVDRIAPAQHDLGVGKQTSNQREVKDVPRHRLDGKAGLAGSSPNRFQVRRRRGLAPTIVVEALKIPAPAAAEPATAPADDSPE